MPEIQPVQQQLPINLALFEKRLAEPRADAEREVLMKLL